MANTAIVVKTATTVLKIAAPARPVLKVSAPVATRVAIVRQPQTSVKVNAPVTRVLKVFGGARGPAGLQGEQGIQGVQGPPGVAGSPTGTATCPSTVVVGQGVAITGPGDGTDFAVGPVNIYEPNAADFRHAVGIVIQKPTATSAIVQFGGVVRDVFTTLDVTVPRYLLGADSQLVATVPPRSGGLVWIVPIGVPLAPNALLIQLSAPGISR